MKFAVCIKCGNAKKRPTDTCRACNFQPKDDAEKAKSLILSTVYEIDGEYRGKSLEELEAIAVDMKAGRNYEFEPAQVAALIDYARKVLGVTPKRLIFDGMKWLGPPIMILAAIGWLLFIKK